MSETLPTVSKVLPPWVDPKDAKDVVTDLPTPQHKQVHINLEQRQDYAILKCPVCGHEYNHLTAVEVRGKAGPFFEVGTRIDAAGTSVFHSPASHGNGVDLEFLGECGHKFIYTLDFIKGHVLVTQREMPKCRQPDSP